MENIKQNLVTVFTDGASSGNPGPGGWGAIIVTPDQQVIEIGGREVPTTNNRMELTAAIQALQYLSNLKAPIEIFTDSTYVIRGITQWVWGWRKRGWITSEGKEVANSDLWKALSELCHLRKIEWKYVRGHQGTPGNERADQIAVEFSQGRKPSLFKGSLGTYEVEIHDVPTDTRLPELSSTTKSSDKKPYSYLSMIGTIPMRHANWNECEKRIKGQSGARFKKAMSQEEERQILLSWGVRPDDVQ